MRRSTMLFLALVATSGLVLAACGDTDDPTDTAGTATTESDAGHADGDHGETSPVADGAREIEVTGSSFEFEPDEITVTAGEDVAIVATVVGVRLARRQLGTLLTTLVDGTNDWAPATRVVLRPPEPAWVRLAVMRC